MTRRICTLRVVLGLVYATAVASCFNPPPGPDLEDSSGTTPGTSGSADGTSTSSPPVSTGDTSGSSSDETTGGSDSSGEPPAVCGDGVVGGDEACDDAGESATCNADCTEAVCGDGQVNATAGELCDDAGASATCDDDCTAVECGDGVVNMRAGEACDDGTQSNEDDCLDGEGGGCQPASCGDGFVQQGVETCDDGNAVQTDACPDGPGATCAEALCGDGFVWAGAETCDDGTTCGTDGWTVDPGMPPAMTTWGIYAAAPPSQTYPQVVFPMPAFGTDGNQTMPYPTDENENSSTESPLMVIPASLDFESWHVDEGTTVDNKAFSISVDGGVTFTTVMDCQDPGTNPAPGYPMCNFNSAIRAPDDWDAVSIPVPMALVGQLGIIRIDYDTLDSCCSFEQGWYMRNANFFLVCV